MQVINDDFDLQESYRFRVYPKMGTVVAGSINAWDHILSGKIMSRVNYISGILSGSVI